MMPGQSHWTQNEAHREEEMEERINDLLGELSAAERRNDELEAEVEWLRRRIHQIRGMIREERRGFTSSKATRLVYDIYGICDDALDGRGDQS